MIHTLSIFAAAGGWAGMEMLSSAPVRFLLLMFFLISLYIALHAPGHGLAETAAILCLGILLGVPLITGVAPWWLALAVVVGLALIAVEIFLVPGFGIPGVAGLFLFLGGLVFVFASPDPSAHHWQALQRAVLVVTSALIAAAVACIMLRRYLPQIPYFKHLILSDRAAEAQMGDAVVEESRSDLWPFVGSTGIALTDLRPGGTVEFDYGHDRRSAPVVSDGKYVPAGSKVIVYEVSGNRILVRSREDDSRVV